jgi:hypothetical protein
MIAETVTVRLIFYGLIAFAPESVDGQPDKLHALLVNATGPQYSSDGCAIPRHVPVLYVQAERCRDNGRVCSFAPTIEKPDQTVSGGWRLDGQLLGIEVLSGSQRRPRQLRAAREKSAPGELPASSEQTESLAWIPSIEKLSVDPDCLGEARDCPIISRVTLNDGRAASCHLAVTPELFELYPYELKPAGASSAAPIRQAMSDAVMVSLEIPRNAKVKITSSPLRAESGTRGRTRSIVLEPGRGDAIDVWVANVPPRHDPGRDFPACHHSASDIDRHFELYYNLANRPVPSSERAVPRRVRTAAVATQIRHASCPLLSFDQNRVAGDRALADDCENRPEGCKIPNDWKSCVGYWFTEPTP